MKFPIMELALKLVMLHKIRSKYILDTRLIITNYAYVWLAIARGFTCVEFQAPPPSPFTIYTKLFSM